ncbi:MAG: HAMP domain-containing histidine kinase, partial [Planctomycetaceae bacterium]|nr:HAMP domain-containing histidine kinase [Planctomycetaceae bacterium]
LIPRQAPVVQQLNYAELVTSLTDAYRLLETGASQIVPEPVATQDLLTLPSANNWALSQVQGSSTELLQRLNVSSSPKAVNLQIASNSLNIPTVSFVQHPRVTCWNGELLLLAGLQQSVAGTTVEGSVLNWQRIRQTLLTEVQDLLPNADLVPLNSDSPPDDHALATIPATLISGDLPPLEVPFWSPMRITVTIAWIGLTVCATATGLVLLQMAQISQRRADFVAAVSHELRTPLTTFQIYTDLLAESDDLPTAKRERYLATLKREARRLTGLVDNILGFARLETTGQSSPAESVEWNHFLRSQLPGWQDRADQSDVALRVVHVEDTTVTLMAHPPSLERILFNLIDNACKYSAGDSHSASASERCIELHCAVRDMLVEIRVSDHGPGISDAARATLFRPFSKSVTEAARTRPGVGLGLFLSRQLARNMNGDLMLEQTSDRGTTFVLTLPLTHFP